MNQYKAIIERQRKQKINESIENAFTYKSGFQSYVMDGKLLNTIFEKEGYGKMDFNDFNIIVIPSDNIVGKTKSYLRLFTFVKFNGRDGQEHLIVYYTSSGSGGKQETKVGQWYPIFGLASNNWLCKTNGSDMARLDEHGLSAPYASRKLGIIKDYLDQHISITPFIEHWKHLLSGFHNFAKTYYPKLLDGTYDERRQIYTRLPLSKMLQRDKAVFALDTTSGRPFFSNDVVSAYLNDDLVNSYYKMLQVVSNMEYHNIPVKDHMDIDHLRKRIVYTLDLLKD